VNPRANTVADRACDGGSVKDKTVARHVLEQAISAFALRDPAAAHPEPPRLPSRLSSSVLRVSCISSRQIRRIKQRLSRRRNYEKDASHPY